MFNKNKKTGKLRIPKQYQTQSTKISDTNNPIVVNKKHNNQYKITNCKKCKVETLICYTINNLCGRCNDIKNNKKTKINIKTKFSTNFNELRNEERIKKTFWNISFDMTYEFWDNTCYLCDSDENLTLSLKDINKGYINNNFFTCCKTCKIMQNNLSLSQFILYIKYVLINNNIINENINNDEINDILTHKHNTFNNFTNNCDILNIKYTIDNILFNENIKKPCFVCKYTTEIGCGDISRINPISYYNNNNTISCCFMCRNVKTFLTKEQILNNFRLIYLNLYPNNIIIIENNIKFNNIKNMHIICNNDTKYYIEKLFTNFNNKINSDNFSINYIDNEELNDMWNYYVNMFNIDNKFYNNIKVNDNILRFLISYDNKYFGMIGLEIDDYVNDIRDEYLNISNNTKIANRNNMCKITLCRNLSSFDGFDYLLPILVLCDYVANIYYRIFDKKIISISYVNDKKINLKYYKKFDTYYFVYLCKNISTMQNIISVNYNVSYNNLYNICNPWTKYYNYIICKKKLKLQIE